MNESKNLLIEKLTSFGLTRQESEIYLCLLQQDSLTGYEVAKLTGISRANTYACLSSLVEKGAVYLMEEESSKYIAVEIKTFIENSLNELTEKAEWIKKHAPEKLTKSEGYITVKNASNIKNKIREMLDNTELRIYFMADSRIMSQFTAELEKLVKERKKVVLLTEGYSLKGAKTYLTETKPGQIRLITDSSYVLTGTYSDSENDTCLYSGQQNLIAVMKEALKNKIILLDKRIR